MFTRAKFGGWKSTDKFEVLIYYFSDSCLVSLIDDNGYVVNLTFFNWNSMGLTNLFIWYFYSRFLGLFDEF